MKKKLKIERRSKSLLKPFLYLLLQLIIVWEVFWILTGYPLINAWNYFELVLCAIMIGYFFSKMVKILKRTKEDSKWDDEIKMQEFLNS